MTQVSITGWKCDVCGYKWKSRTDSKPVRCARCKSPYWDKKEKNADTDKRIHAGIETDKKAPHP